MILSIKTYAGFVKASIKYINNQYFIIKIQAIYKFYSRIDI